MTLPKFILYTIKIKSSLPNDILPDHRWSGFPGSDSDDVFSSTSSSTTERQGVRGFKNKKTSGFTLIELLVVVAIIAILVSVGATAFTQARRQGRDATRKTDMEKIASALEQYYADKGFYPESSVAPDPNKIVCGGATIDWGGDFTCDGKTYLKELPEDPIGTNQYKYEPTTLDESPPCSNVLTTNFYGSCQKFTISAELERDPGTSPSPCTGSYNYCVSKP